DQAVQRRQRVRVDVPVDDHVLMAAFQQRAEGQEREREDALSGGVALRVVQDEPQPRSFVPTLRGYAAALHEYRAAAAHPPCTPSARGRAEEATAPAPPRRAN